MHGLMLRGFAPMGKVHGEGKLQHQQVGNTIGSYAQPAPDVHGVVAQIPEPLNDINGEVDQGPSVPWTIFIARGISRIGRNLEVHLLGKQLMTHYCEWCSTPRPIFCGVAYEDVAFVYDCDATTPLRQTSSPADRKRIYIGIPHPLLDPVLKAAMDEVSEFYQQSFWGNH